MIRDAASSSTCSGASAGGSGVPSDGSPQIQPACPRSGPHSAAAGSPAPGSLAPADSVSLTPPVSPRPISTSNHLISKYLCPEGPGSPPARGPGGGRADSVVVAFFRLFWVESRVH